MPLSTAAIRNPNFSEKFRSLGGSTTVGLTDEHRLLEFLFHVLNVPLNVALFFLALVGYRRRRLHLPVLKDGSDETCVTENTV